MTIAFRFTQNFSDFTVSMAKSHGTLNNITRLSTHFTQRALIHINTQFKLQCVFSPGYVHAIANYYSLNHHSQTYSNTHAFTV